MMGPTEGAMPGGSTPGGSTPGTSTLGGSGRGFGSAPVPWVIGGVLYGVEIVVLAVFCMAIGGLSAMLADICFRDNTELICEPRWQTITALTPITALVAAVLAMGAFVLWRRRMWTLITAMVVTPLVPLVAFMIMQEVVTA